MKKTMLKTACLALAALIVLCPALQAQSAGTLKSISTQKEGHQLQVLVMIDGAFTREVSFLTSPKRLVVDLTGVATIAAAPYMQVGDAGILDIRTGQFKPDTARLVLDMGQATPAYTVTEIPGGLKLAFWLEAADEAQAQEPIKEPVREPARETVRQAQEQTSSEPYSGRTGFFLRLGAGMAFFLNPTHIIESDFPLYGETASSVETYTWKSGIAADISIGKYFHIGSLPIKAGLAFSYWQFMPEVNVALSLPHPFLTGSNRSVEFSESTAMASAFMRYSAYAMFSFLDSGKISVWFGPIVGVTKGKLITLDDYTIEENAPYAAADIRISDKAVYEHVISQFHAGAWLGIEYRLDRKLSLGLDAKFLIFSPKSIRFADSFNLMSLQPTLSLQYSF